MDVTVAIPAVGTEAYFSFKEPYNLFIRNRFNINTLSVKLKVISVISIRDTIRTDLRDPFTDTYEVAGVDEPTYKIDLNNNVYLISFSFRTSDGVERFVRVPLSFVASISNAASVEYSNRLLALDLGKLPKELDLTAILPDLEDFIATRLGVSPIAKDISVGAIELITPAEHDARETIRQNSVTVHKTLSVQLAESQLALTEIHNRLDTLGIALG